MNKIIKQILILTCLIALLVLPYFVFAQEIEAVEKLKTVAGGGGFSDIGESETGIAGIVGTIITAFLSILGVIFLVLMLYGGYLWMMDRGNSEQVEKAKQVITAAIIGLIIVVAAYAITQFIYAYIIEGSGAIDVGTGG